MSAHQNKNGYRKTKNMIDNHRIQFERPDLPKLIKENTVVDLHFHSHYSDGFNTVKAIAHKAFELGIGIAVTDHNEIRGAVEIDGYPDVLFKSLVTFYLSFPAKCHSERNDVKRRISKPLLF